MAGMAVSAKELLAAANETARREATQWFFFVTVMLYLTVAVGSVTHRKLFFDEPIPLPVISVAVPLTGFFVVAPAILVVLHFYVLAQARVLREKLAAAVAALRAEGGAAAGAAGERDGTNRAWFQVDPYPVAQAVAGAMLGQGALPLRLMAWLTLIAAPVLLLLFFQVRFLPYQDPATTWWHRVLVLVDLALVWWLWRPVEAERSLCGPRPGKLWVAVAGTISGGAFVFTFGLATVVDEWLDRLLRFWPLEGARASLFDGEVDEKTNRPTSLFSRALMLPNERLISDAQAELLRRIDAGELKVAEGQPDPVPRTMVLRGRSLRRAVLTATDLRRADLTWVNLSDARLDMAWLHGAYLDNAILTRSSLQGAFLNSTRMQFASFEKSKLQGASFEQADAQSVNLTGAYLQGASLANAHMNRALLVSASLQGAYLFQADLSEANLKQANLQASDLRNAKLERASLANADIQGGMLVRASLDGAKIEGTGLEAADLREASLRGAQGLARMALVDSRGTIFGQPQRQYTSGRPLSPPGSSVIGLGNSHRDLSSPRNLSSSGPAKFLHQQKVQAQQSNIEAQIRERIAPPGEVAKKLQQLACQKDDAPHIARGVLRQIRVKPEKGGRDLGDHRGPLARALLDEAACPGARGLTARERDTLRAIAEGLP
ncbi:pentapeptide repeat-containing protein [Elioraea thermophila]|uniref:pentapeptide repeat-containing protein n=1 Tax=Elioraea thermophila TaxID=2185104 RepID=UPI000DF1ED47|nr:pentapeptide repeat-containing protein [Elioraea thermophila]